MAETPPTDPFEMFRRLWGPLGVPLPGMAMPTFDPQEVDKRIAELLFRVEAARGYESSGELWSPGGYEIELGHEPATLLASPTGSASRSTSPSRT